MGAIGGLTILIILAVIILWLIITNIRIVPEATAFVIERLGKYKETWNAGLHLKVPIIETVARKVSLKEQVLDFPPQPVITKDNVIISLDSVVFCKVFDPQLYTYGVDNPLSGLQNLAERDYVRHRDKARTSLFVLEFIAASLKWRGSRRPYPSTT